MTFGDLQSRTTSKVNLGLVSMIKRGHSQSASRLRISVNSQQAGSGRAATGSQIDS